MATTLRHTPDDPARCPKCGGEFRNHPGYGNLMVCENAFVPTSPYAFGMPVREPALEPTCAQEPMYLIPDGA